MQPGTPMKAQRSESVPMWSPDSSVADSGRASYVLALNMSV